KLEKNLHEKIELIRLLQSITVAANESISLAEAVQISLTLVCRYMDWPVGHVYYVDPENENQLKPGAQWFVRDENKYENFHRITDQRIFQSGEGLPGIVFSTGAPQWIEDVTRFENFPRSKMGLDIKVKAAFAFPVMMGKNVGAVLEFFSDQPTPPNKDLMESMRHVGTQLGRIIERHNAEQSLLNSEKHFRALIENALDIVTILDPQADFSFLSPSTEIVLGYAPAELKGLNAFTFIHPEDVNFVMEKFTALVNDPGQTQSAQFRFKHKNGGWIHLESIGKNLLAEPSVTGIVVNSRDISEQRSAELELKKQAQLLKSIIDNMGEGLLVCDAQGKTLFVNPAADQMLGGQIGDPLPGEKEQKNEVYKSDGETVLMPNEFPVTRALYGESSDNIELYIKNSRKPGGVYV
ncbi:MAG TPA: PAS domain S-box protein, partial [bacterium]|nr:PAS domain S-box protein [bacterium]